MSNKPKKETANDYEVGYGKPPKATQFVKGQSGNPSGRPTGKRNHATILNDALNEKVSVTENGKRITITKLEAMFKQIVNKATTGDSNSIKQLIQMFPWLDRLSDDGADTPSNSEADMQLLKQMEKRLLAKVNKDSSLDDDDKGEVS